MSKIKLVTKFDAPKKAKKAFRNTEHKALEEALDIRDKNLSKLSGSIDDAKGIVFNRKEIEAIDEFIEYYDGDADESYMDQIAARVIELAKAIDENSEDVKMIPDAKYDRILNIYLRHGHDEPLPKTVVTGGVETISTGYEKLANNLDKSYTVYDEDEIPFGVSDGNESVETFLKKAYAAAKYDKTTKIEVEITPKFDGVSVNGDVKAGIFGAMSTRGDDGVGLHIKGLEGFKISAKAPIIKAGEFGAQFEAFVTYSDAKAIAENEGIVYTSNRSAASGIINRATNPKKFDPKLLKYLSFYPIAVDGVEFDSHEERAEFLMDMYKSSAPVIDRNVIKGDLKTLLKGIKSAFEKYGAAREKLEYSIDGIVITILDDGMIDALGRKGRKNKFQVALKFDPSRESGEIKMVTLSAGKKGYRTLMAELEKPVNIDGVDYRTIQIKTVDEFEKLDLHVGDRVVVTRGGDVIPQIDKIEKSGDGKKIKLPTHCPYCDSKLEIKRGTPFCSYDYCSGNHMGAIVNFFEALNVKGVGWGVAERLNSNLMYSVDTIIGNASADVFAALIPGGEKIYNAMIEALTDLNPITALVAVGAEGIGPGKAAKILEEVSFNEILECSSEDEINAIVERLKKVSGLGKSIEEYFRNLLEERESLVALKPFVVEKRINKNATKIGHTGFVKGSDEMDTLERIIGDSEDFRIVEGKSFDILVTKSYDSDSGKMKSANKKGLSVNDGIYTLKDFKNLMESKENLN